MMVESCLPVSYQAMTAADLTDVMRLEQASMAQPFRESQMRQMWAATSAYSWRVLRTCHHAAAGGVLAYCCYLLQDDEAHVLRLGCWPQVQGQRLGRWLMLNVLHEFRAARLCWVHLEVHQANARARRLYHRLGFQVVGCRKRYYPDQGDALLLSLALGPEGQDAVQFARLCWQTQRELYPYRPRPHRDNRIRETA